MAHSDLLLDAEAAQGSLPLLLALEPAQQLSLYRHRWQVRGMCLGDVCKQDDGIMFLKACLLLQKSLERLTAEAAVARLSSVGEITPKLLKSAAAADLSPNECHLCLAIIMQVGWLVFLPAFDSPPLLDPHCAASLFCNANNTE